TVYDIQTWYNKTISGNRSKAYDELDIQGDYYYNSTTKNLSIYSTSNPASYYSEIYLAVETRGGAYGIIQAQSTSYLLFDNLDVRYGGVLGISTSRSTNVTVQNCTVKYIGGTIQTGTTRYGNCIQFWANSTNIKALYNDISYCFDAGITPQSATSAGSVTMNNIEIAYNILSHNYYGVEYFNSHSDSQTYNLSVHHNTIAFTEEIFEWGRQYPQAVRLGKNPLLSNGTNFS
ncbi:unnamed protein product, partial [marine sediment metagenome]